MPPPVANVLLNPGFFATYAVVQAIVLLLLFRLLEPFERPKLSTMFLLALWGATAAAVIAAIGNEAVTASIPEDARQVFGSSIAPPVVEEFAKGLALVLAVIASRTLISDAGGWRFEGVTAGLICGAAVGIGFSFTEDFFYFVNHATDEGVRTGADIYLGRRDFFGPTALHHPLFTAAFGAGIGAAAMSTSWRGRIGWPLAGLAIAILMHAVNNGLIELMLWLRHGLDAASDWAMGAPVAASVQQTANDANSVLVVLDYTYILAILAAGMLLHRRARLAVAEALEPDVESGLIGEEDRSVVCGLGTRAGTYVRLFLSGQRDRLRRTREHHREIARLGTARLRAATGPGDRGSLAEARRRLVAASGVAREPGSVPAPELAIIGRERELTELSELLLSRGTRQVTITGPGGAGKTRLAVELVSAIGERFAHGAFFVDLSTLSEPDQVSGAVAEALELGLPPGEEPGAWLGRLLRDRDLLLALDNFEHLIEAAPLVTTLIRAAPRLRIAVTSRSVLGLQGETEYRLAPLSVKDAGASPSPAATLFVDRAARAGAGLDDPDLVLVGRICERLDGLPLAIELVASRTRALSLASIARRLDTVLDLAATTSSAVPERQRTLRGAVAWSEELLSAEARGVFLSLAQFPAGCRLEMLEREAEDPSLPGNLQVLVESSLLRPARDPDGEPRYRMLATVRDYALEQLDRATGSPLVSVEGYCHALVRAMARDGEGLPETLPVLDLERPNLSTAVDELDYRGAAEEALGLMVDLGPLWERGSIGEARERLARVMRGVLEGEGGSLPRGRQLAGRLALLQGDYPEASGLLHSVLAEPVADPALRFACHLQLGWVETFLGDLEGAEARFSTALSAAPGLGPGQHAQAALGLGRVRAERGDAEAGQALAGQSLRLWEQVGDRRGATGARSTRARISLLGGDAEEAESRARQALEQARELGDQLRQAEAMFPLSSGLLLLGRVEEAARMGVDRLGICRDLGDRLGIAEVLDLVGLLLELRGKRGSALSAIQGSDGLRKRTGAMRWPFEQVLIEDRLGPAPPHPPPDSEVGSLSSAASLAEELLRSVAGIDGHAAEV